MTENPEKNIQNWTSYRKQLQVMNSGSRDETLSHHWSRLERPNGRSRRGSWGFPSPGLNDLLFNPFYMQILIQNVGLHVLY